MAYKDVRVCFSQNLKNKNKDPVYLIFNVICFSRAARYENLIQLRLERD